MCSNLSLFRKPPYETRALAACCSGKQFVSRKVSRGIAKLLSAWLTLSASARASVPRAAFCSEATEENRSMRWNQDAREALQCFVGQGLVDSRFPRNTNVIIHGVQQCLNFPQAKGFAWPEGYLWRGEGKRGKGKHQFQVKKNLRSVLY